MFDLDHLDVYTDGSCKFLTLTDHQPNYTFGAWAFVAVRNGEVIHQECKSYHGTTNNRMELAAVLEALRYAEKRKSPHDIASIHCDSAYVINAYKQEWYKRWETNGWRTSTNRPVLNRDLWEQLIPFFDSKKYDFKKVAGHSGHKYNEMCDTLAQAAAQARKDNWRGQNDRQDYI